jgi:hypothetical protein
VLRLRVRVRVSKLRFAEKLSSMKDKQQYKDLAAKVRS